MGGKTRPLTVFTCGLIAGTLSAFATRAGYAADVDCAKYGWAQCVSAQSECGNCEAACGSTPGDCVENPDKTECTVGGGCQPSAPWWSECECVPE